MRQLAFEPLYLDNTHLLSLPDDADYAQNVDPNLADGYGFTPGQAGYNPTPSVDPSQLEGAGSLVSNCSDLLAWLRHLFTGDYIDMAHVKLMATPPSNAVNAGGKPSTYGMGLYTFHNSDGSTYAILHNGEVAGFQSVDMNFGVVGSTTSYQIVVLTNNDSDKVPKPATIAEKIYQLMTGIAPPPPGNGTAPGS
jgi:CubicO group peptidase (beta-lactamase class C family)